MSTEKQEIFYIVGARLREERERLEKSQKFMAEALGADIKTWNNYERGASVPDAHKLTIIATVGVDVLYVLTGNRTPVVTLSSKESVLVENYRSATPEHQSTLDTVSAALAQPGVGKKAGGA